MNDRSPEPMGIGRAIEVIKTLDPYVEKLINETDPLIMLGDLIDGIQEINPTDSLRLVALMFGMSIDDVVDTYGDPEKSGSMLLKSLTEGFAANPLPDLINTGVMFGILQEGWTDVRTE